MSSFSRAFAVVEPINNGEYMVNSTLLTIMGRMATYTGQMVSWEQVMACQQRLGPSTYGWGDVPVEPVAIPGVTSLT